MKKLITTAVLAFAGTVLCMQSASAQGISPQNLSYNADDLILSFRATGSPGSTTDIEIDLGQATIFTGGTNVTLTGHSAGSTLGNIFQDLSNTYGTNWYARNDVIWSIIGAAPKTNNTSSDLSATIYATNSSTTDYTTHSAGGSQGTLSNTISNTFAYAYANAGDGSIKTSSTNSALSLIQANTTANSYTHFATESIPFNSFTGLEATPGNSLYFDQLVPSSNSSPANTLGSFSIASNGDVTFTAVPEPSTYASLGLGLALLFLITRRRRTIKAS